MLLKPWNTLAAVMIGFMLSIIVSSDQFPKFLDLCSAWFSRVLERAGW